MWKPLQHWLDDIAVRDPIERQQAALLQILLIGLMLALVLAIVLNLFVFGLSALTPAGLGPNLLALLSVGGVLSLLRRGHFRGAVWLVIGVLFVGLAQALFSAGLRNNTGALVELTIPILLAGLLIGRRCLVMSIGLSLAIVFGVAALEAVGVPWVGSVPLPDDPTGATLVVFVLSVGLLGLFLDRFGVVFRESEARLRAIVEAIPIPLTINSREAGVILYGNSALSELLGVPLAEIVGQRAVNYYADPGERPRIIADLQQRGALYDYEVRLRRPNGAFLWVSLSTEALTLSTRRRSNCMGPKIKRNYWARWRKSLRRKATRSFGKTSSPSPKAKPILKVGPSTRLYRAGV